MKKITMMILSAAALLTTACSSSDEMQQQTAQTGNGWSEYITVEAGTPGGADISTNGSRRVAVDTSNPLKSLWEDGDKLTVWAGDGCSTANMSENGFTLISGAGTGTAKFSGRLKSATPPTNETKLIAVIDKENDAIDASAGNIVSANLSEQQGATAETALDYELYWAESTNATRNFTFTHKMSLIKWTIKVNGASNNDQCDIVLSGTGLKNSATLDPATGTLTPGTDDGTITLKNVTLNAGNTVLYVVVPPCTVSSSIKATLSMTSESKRGQVAIGALGAFTSCEFVGNNLYTAGLNEFTLRDNVVDLGLPNGTLWAKMNVGASSPEDYGLFFAWGETTGYSSVYANPMTDHSFDWASYKWMASGQSSWESITKYTFADDQTTASWYDNGTFIGDGKTELESADDAATANWGSAWKMPTHAQWQELAANCYWEWTTDYSGVAGYIVYAIKNEADKGKMKDSQGDVYDISSEGGAVLQGSYSPTDDPHIFLPAAGYRNDTRLLDQGLRRGYYWSSELHSDNSYNAWRLFFRDGKVFADSFKDRSYGQCVRPVLVK